MKSEENQVGSKPAPLKFSREALDELWPFVVGVKPDKKEGTERSVESITAEEISKLIHFLEVNHELFTFFKDGKKVGLIIQSRRVSLCSDPTIPSGVVFLCPYFFDRKKQAIQVVVDQKVPIEARVMTAIFYLENQWILPTGKLRQLVATNLKVDLENVLAYI